MTNQTLDQQKLTEAASKLRALSHPSRIAIVSLLENNEQLSVTEIYEALRIEQATASHHLNILKTKGLLDSRRCGKNTFYFIKHQALSQIIECLNRCH